MRAVLVAVGLVASACGGAGAAPLPDFAKDSVGEWLVAGEGGKPGCRITLGADPTGGGWRAQPSPACTERVPAVSRATAWRYEGGIGLLDAGGKTILDFQEDETTLLKTNFAAGPVFFLVRAKNGVERAPFAPDLVGRWVLRRPGGPALCPLVLAKASKDGETELSLEPGAPCDPAVARLRLNGARVEDFTLMLYGRPETSLRFEPSGPDRFAKAEAGRPLEMVRAP